MIWVILFVISKPWLAKKNFIWKPCRILMVGLPSTLLPIGRNARLASCWPTPTSTWTSRTASDRLPLTLLTLMSCGYLKSWKRSRTTAVKTGQILSPMCSVPNLVNMLLHTLPNHLNIFSQARHPCTYHTSPHHPWIGEGWQEVSHSSQQSWTCVGHSQMSIYSKARVWSLNLKMLVV